MTDRILQADASIPAEVNGMVIPDQDEVTGGIGIGALAIAMGIRLVSFSANEAIAVMPVAGNEQPVGLLHGGAHCVLGETLGSLAAIAHAKSVFGPQGQAVGLDINATHTRAVRSGWVTGRCRAVHLGRTVTVHEIAIDDAQGRRCSTIRITNLVRVSAATGDRG